MSDSIFLQNSNIDYVIYYTYPEQAIKLKIDSIKYYYGENGLITKENWRYNNIDEYWDLSFTENIYYDSENRLAQEWFCPSSCR